MTLTKFVKKYYHVFFEICLWIVLIASTISGFFSGNFLLYRYFGISVSQLFGGIIGLIFGLIIIVTIGGFSAIILNYFKNIEEISENLNDLSIFASLIMKKHNINVPDVEDNDSETWVCGNCSFRNEIYLSNCKNCGKSFER